MPAEPGAAAGPPDCSAPESPAAASASLDASEPLVAAALLSTWLLLRTRRTAARSLRRRAPRLGAGARASSPAPSTPLAQPLLPLLAPPPAPAPPRAAAPAPLLMRANAGCASWHGRWRRASSSEKLRRSADTSPAPQSTSIAQSTACAASRSVVYLLECVFNCVLARRRLVRGAQAAAGLFRRRQPGLGARPWCGAAGARCMRASADA